MNKYKKHISAILICSIFLFSQAKTVEATPGLVIPALIATGAALFTAGAVKYYAPVVNAPTAPYFTNALSAGRLAVATFSASAQYGVNTMQSKYVTMKATIADFAAYIKSAASMHPDMFKAMFPSVKGTGDITALIAGDSVLINGTEYRVQDVRPVETEVGCQPTTPDSYLEPNGGGGSWVTFSSGGTTPSCQAPNHSLNRQQVWVTAGVHDTTPYASADINKNFQKLGGYAPEVISYGFDEAIRSNPGAWKVVDTATPDKDLLTAPPFLPTAAVPLATSTTVPTSQGYDLANAALSQRHQTAANSQAAVDDYKNNHPGATIANDPVLAGLASKAATDAAAEKAAQTLADTLAAERDVALPDATVDTVKAVDFTPFLALNGLLANKFPFTLLASIGGYFTVFDAPATAPVFDIPIVGNHMIIDLSFMDTVASVSRYTIAFLLSIGCIFFIVRRYIS